MKNSQLQFEGEQWGETSDTPIIEDHNGAYFTEPGLLAGPALSYSRRGNPLEKENAKEGGHTTQAECKRNPQIERQRRRLRRESSKGRRNGEKDKFRIRRSKKGSHRMRRKQT